MGGRNNILNREDYYPDPTVQGVNDIVRFAFEAPSQIYDRVSAPFSPAAEPGVGGKLRAIANPGPVLDRQRGMDAEAKAPEFFGGIRQEMERANALLAEADSIGAQPDNPRRKDAHNLGMSAHTKLMGWVPKMIANGQDPNDIAPLIQESARLAGYTINPAAPGGPTDAYRLGMEKPSVAGASERDVAAEPVRQQNRELLGKKTQQEMDESATMMPFETGYKGALTRESRLRGDVTQHELDNVDEGDAAARRDESDKRRKSRLDAEKTKAETKKTLIEAKYIARNKPRAGAKEGDPLNPDDIIDNYGAGAGGRPSPQPSPEPEGDVSLPPLDQLLMPETIAMIESGEGTIEENRIREEVRRSGHDDPRIARKVYELIKAGAIFNKYGMKATPTPARQ